MLYIVVFILITLFIFIIFYDKNKHKINCSNISHACGLLNYTKYTNALEGFYLSYYKGYRNIEIDILETKDQHIIGGRDWNTFKILTKYKSKDDVNYTFIKHAKILDKYHIIYDYMINNLLSKYKDVNIFIDKIANYKLLKKYISDIDRLYVEVFSYSQFNKSKSLGFKNVMLNIRKKTDLYNLLYNNYLSITSITIGPDIFYSYKSQLQKLYNKDIKIYAFLIYNITDIKNALCKYITGFYID